MINHKHKCIFIHIPRTAGTALEIAIQGHPQREDHLGDRMYWRKHLQASVAKQLYSEYWDDYYKFSFVRNPWDRVVSLARFPKFYHVNITNTIVDISNYITNTEQIEKDPRVPTDGYRDWQIDNGVYCNILNEPLDFIGKYENLETDFNRVCEAIGLSCDVIPTWQPAYSQGRDHYSTHYTDQTREQIRARYEHDIQKFNYSY